VADVEEPRDASGVAGLDERLFEELIRELYEVFAAERPGRPPYSAASSSASMSVPTSPARSSGTSM
jgi:hypothetical protein